jgi:hypothetical protein
MESNGVNVYARTFGFWLVILCLGRMDAIDKVVIWGHKLHTHTHSYIHEGFFRAFENLGYPTYWFDKLDDIADFDFSNTFFITEGQVDQGEGDQEANSI